MDNPFPGMNPYTESQGFWRDFHTSLIGTMRAALNGVLPLREWDADRADALLSEALLTI